MVYSKGQRVALTFTFTDANGVATDVPSTSALEVKRPSGLVDRFTVADADHTGQGVYVLHVIGDEPGRWFYGRDGDTNVEAANVRYFTVAESPFS